jgi:non-canonical purine NTP pyrophosphatase (RdgB/HAM1 family)
MKVVIATKNAGKLREFQELASEAPWLELVMAPEGFDPAESGSTFFENAKIKAQAAAKLSGLLSIADDSGLVVEGLNGKPGIHSARYCEGTDADRRKKLVEDMSKLPEGKRDASFVCSMVLCDPTGEVLNSVVRYWSGKIGFEDRGSNGFGYDPIFYLNDRPLTAAELTSEDKNRISHRGQAWRQMLAFLLNRRETVKQP